VLRVYPEGAENVWKVQLAVLPANRVEEDSNKQAATAKAERRRPIKSPEF